MRRERKYRQGIKNITGILRPVMLCSFSVCCLRKIISEVF